MKSISTIPFISFYTLTVLKLQLDRFGDQIFNDKDLIKKRET